MELAPVLIEITALVATIIGGIRYLTTQNTKREERVLEHHEKQQQQMLEFYEKKNGHLERISKDFTEAVRDNSRIISSLNTEIKILAKSHNKENGER